MITSIMVFIVSSNLFVNIAGGCCLGYPRSGPPVRICWLGDSYFRLPSPSSQHIQRLCHIWCGSTVSAQLPHQGLCQFHGQPRVEHHNARVLQPVVSGWYIFQLKEQFLSWNICMGPIQKFFGCSAKIITEAI